MRLRALIVLAAVAALAAIAGARAAQVERLPPRYVSDAASQRAAQRDMKDRLAHLSLPPGGRFVGARSPLAAKRLRGRYPFLGTGAFHLAWKTRFAFVRAPVRQVVSWLSHHPPSGSKLMFGTGPGNGSGRGWYRCRYFAWPDGRPEIGERGISFCGVKAHGGTSVRIDVQAEWLEGRGPFERLPGGSRYLEVIATYPKKRDRRATVTDQKLIAHVVAIVNSLPLTQHTSYTCPHGIEGHSPLHPAITMIFRARRNADPIARLYQSLPVESGCRPLHFQLRGRSERSLDEGWLVIRALDRTIERARPIREQGSGE